MKKVLIALDYNPTAEKIAETGHALAKAMNAQTILLHIIYDPAYYYSLNYSPIMGFESFTDMDLLQRDTLDEIKKSAQAYLNKSKQHLGDDMIETVIKEGDTGETILATAAEMNADIIVMGSHSRRGLDKILMGSVAENVLHHSSIPLFIVPTKPFEEK